MTTLFLQRILGSCGIILSQRESIKIFTSWILKFILHTSTVLGFTLILALFIGEYGLENLPELFGVEALFSIAGTILFTYFLRTISHKDSLIVGSLTIFMFTIIGFFLKEANTPLFFGALIFTYSVIITQLNIIFFLFVEELFSPLQSERAFPLIESAEPVGGIFAGIITGIGVLFMSPEHLILVWGGITLILLPVLFLTTKKLEKVPKPHCLADHVEKTTITEDLKKSWGHIVTNPFLRMLFGLVVVQFMVFNLIEFQYSTAAAELFIENHSGSHHSSDSVSQELAHGLGLAHIGLYGLLLIFQLFFSSKIQKRLGVVQTIFLHPLMVFFSASIMAIKFSFASALFTKGSFEIFGGPSRNAYHASFYAFRPHVRERAKEFLEGVARPLGMLIGTGLILFVQAIVHKFSLSPLAMSSMISFIITICIGWKYLSKQDAENKYTLLARKNLETRGRAPEKLDAIEILSQKGHKNASSSLLKILQMKNEKKEIKLQILSTIGKLKDPNAIPEILKCLDDEHIEIQRAALQSLAQYKNLGDHFLTQSFAKHRVIEVLQRIFVESKSKSLKKLVIQVFQNIQHPEIIPFLLESLHSDDEETVLGAIRVCGIFKDISSTHYIEPFLKHKNGEIQAAAIIAMWKFKSYRLRLTLLIASLFEKKEKESIKNAIYIVGEIKGIHEFKRLLQILKESQDIEIQKHIYVALAKMEHSIAVRELSSMLLHHNKDFSSSVRKLIFAPSVSQKVKHVIQKYLEQDVSHKIHSLLRKEGEEILEKMKTSTLHQLHDAYEVIGEFKEMMKISEVIEEREAKEVRKILEAEKQSPSSTKNPEKKHSTKESLELSLNDLL